MNEPHKQRPDYSTTFPPWAFILIALLTIAVLYCLLYGIVNQLCRILRLILG